MEFCSFFKLYSIPLYVLLLLTVQSVAGDDFKITIPDKFSIPETEIPAMKTFGGRQFWADVHFFRGWRIQKNIFTKNYRLLNTENYRYARGSFKDCLKKLNETKKEEKIPEMTGAAVIVVHGILRSSKSFSSLKTRLKKDHYEVVSFDYPSTQIEIKEAAEYLHQTIDSLEGIKEIHFVVHSMGGLLVRAYLKEHRDSRIKRMVMLGVPNFGAKMADHLKTNLLFRAIFGPAGQQLISDPEGFVDKLPIPDFEFGIIAGARGTENGYNPFISGDDDGTVSVLSTKLPGASDFISVHCLHSFMPSHVESSELAVRFIEKGHFRETGDPQPIPLEEETKEDEKVIAEKKPKAESAEK
jgi:pimeloyl-ACP methyl ester carboxylesterase